MLVVHYWSRSGTLMSHQYPHDYEPKVLACGVLKIYEPGEVEVPDLGQEDEDIGVTPARLVALYNGEYYVEWTQ